MLIENFSKFTSEPSFDMGDFIDPKVEVKRSIDVLNGKISGGQRGFVLLYKNKPVSVIVGNFFNGAQKTVNIKYLVSKDELIKKGFYRKWRYTPAELLSLKFLGYAKRAGYLTISSTNTTKLGEKFFQRLENLNYLKKEPKKNAKKISNIPKLRRRA